MSRVSGLQLFQTKTSTQVFSCELCRIFKNNLFYRTHPVAAHLIKEDTKNHHCVKNVQIRSFFWTVFSRIRIEYEEIRSISLFSVRIWENTDQKQLRICTLSTQCMLYFSKKLKRVTSCSWVLPQ